MWCCGGSLQCTLCSRCVATCTFLTAPRVPRVVYCGVPAGHHFQFLHSLLLAAVFKTVSTLARCWAGVGRGHERHDHGQFLISRPSLPPSTDTATWISQTFQLITNPKPLGRGVGRCARCNRSCVYSVCAALAPSSRLRVCTRAGARQQNRLEPRVWIGIDCRAHKKSLSLL